MISGSFYLNFSYTLLDEKDYSIHLGSILEFNGQKYLNSVLETHKRPFAIFDKEETHSTSIMKIVEIFQNEVINCCKSYFPSWNNHINKPEMYYSKPMREVVFKDLQFQSSHISISTPLFSDIIIFLNDFDKICHCPWNEATIVPMMPQVNSWLNQK